MLISKFFLIIIFLAIFQLPLKSSLSSETNNYDKLIINLVKAKNEDERKIIFNTEKDRITPQLIVDLLLRANNSSSMSEKEKLTDIAIESAQIKNDKISLGKAFLYKANIEFLQKNDVNPESLQKALEIFQKYGDKKGEGSCYYRQASYLQFSLQNEKALNILLKSFEVFDKSGEEFLKGDCYRMEGQLYRDLGNNDKSLENFSRAIKIYDHKEDIVSIMSCYEDMVALCLSLGLFYEGENYLKSWKDLIDIINPGDVIDLSNNEEGYIFRDNKFKDKNQLTLDYYKKLGLLYVLEGKYSQAIKVYSLAIPLLDKIKKLSYGELDFYWTLGSVYSYIGQKDMALKYYLEGLQKNTDDKVLGYWLLGNFYLKEMKKPDEAMKYYMIALEKSKEIDIDTVREQHKAECLRHIGQVYLEKGEFTLAIDNLTEALNFYENNKWGVFNYAYPSVCDELGEAYGKKGDREKALYYYNKALDFSKNTPNLSYWVLKAYKYLGDFYFVSEDYKNALEFYLKALELGKEMGWTPMLWEYYFSAGKIYEKEGDVEKAYDSYKKSIEIIENMRQELKVEELKRDFMQDKIKVYEHMIKLLLTMGREKDAFNYNEQSRSRAFMDILGNQKVEIHHGLSEELISKEEKLITRIRFLSSDLMQEKSKSLINQRAVFIDKTEKELKILKSEYQELLKEIKLQNPEYMTFISVNPITIDEIQSSLDKDTVIIEYFLGEKESYVWVIGYDSFNTAILKHNEKEIEDAVKEYRYLACDDMTVEKLKNDRWKEVAKKIYSMLFKDIEKYTDGKIRLMIGPHRTIYYLPFQVLTDNNDKMLVEKYDITYIPSASILRFCENKNTFSKNSLLAFELGNFKTENILPIPGTEIEIKNISPFFSKKEIYSGKDMTTDILYEKGRDFDILHMATHGILDRVEPLFSSLVFSDRKLNVYEIFNLDLKAYLVCLSACRTSIGEDANGDELVGLSRAFIYAGSPTICSSLWDVSDVSTSELMERFYYYLKDNNKGKALRLAELDLMKKYKHPYFWAPFILLGDWR